MDGNYLVLCLLEVCMNCMLLVKFFILIFYKFVEKFEVLLNFL